MEEAGVSLPEGHVHDIPHTVREVVQGVAFLELGVLLGDPLYFVRREVDNHVGVYSHL